MNKLDRGRQYVSRKKYEALNAEIQYMEGKGRELLAKLLASSPGSGMGRPNDLPIHPMAGEFMGYLQEIKAIVNNAVILEEFLETCADQSAITVGWTARVRYEGEDQPETYTILDRHEVDVQQGRISYWSPIGAALMGKHVGDVSVSGWGLPLRRSS